MEEWYDPTQTKRQLPCILNGCKPCVAKIYCQTHDKPVKGNIPSLPSHCAECGEYIYDINKDTKGMFEG